ncbi:hypothetical protein WN943_016221 [Citrus x changshan-huyou]
MPELLCRRDRDGDGANDEYAVREDFGFPNEDGLLDYQHLTAPNPEGLITPFPIPRERVLTSFYCWSTTLPNTRNWGTDVWEKYVDETRHGEQISDGRVLRTGVFRKSLVRGGTGAEISCSSTSTSSARPTSCKRHKAIPARGREARRPGRRQLAIHALQPENLGTTTTLSPEPRRNTQDPTFVHNAAYRSSRSPILSPKKRKQDLTEPRQPRFPQNRGVTRKIPRLPITQQNLWRRNLTRRPPGRDEVDRAEILVVERGEPDSCINTRLKLSWMPTQKCGERSVIAAALGAVIRNYSGQVIAAAANSTKFQGIISIVEARAVKWGMEMAKEASLTDLIIEIDCCGVADLAGVCFKGGIACQKFEELCELKHSGLKMDKIYAVELIGGATKSDRIRSSALNHQKHVDVAAHSIYQDMEKACLHELRRSRRMGHSHRQ